MSADPGLMASYATPPILEASITISISNLPPERYALLGMVGQKLGDAYPRAELLSEFRAGFLDLEPGTHGMAFTSRDGRCVVQARSDGFTFGQLKPYSGWDIFLDGAQSAWQAYKSVVSPIELRRLRVKYVNSIPFPLGIPLEKLFNTFPKMPDQSVLLESLSMHYRYAVEEIPRMIASVLMMNNGTPEESGRMLLDNTFTVPVRDDDDIWRLLPSIRKLKNDLFESQLTQSLKETFNG